MNDTSQSRFPNLGHLSLALFEHVTESIVGGAAQNILKAPVVEKELQDSLARILIQVEQRFLKECQDTELRQVILALPLANLPSLKRALRGFYDRPIDSAFSEILYDRLSTDFPGLPELRIRSAISDYLRVLRQELVSFSAHVRDPLNALALQDIQNNTAQIVELLKSVQGSEQGKSIESGTPSVQALFVDYLHLVQNRLQDTRKKFPHDPQRN